MVDKTMEKLIKSYGEEIQTLKNFADAVRINYSMYIGYNNEKGILHLIKEIFGNSTDELRRASRGLSPCTTVYVEFIEGTCFTKVCDDGRGIPFDKAIDVCSNLHTSSNYVKQKGDFVSGINGVGAKIVNALSELFILESHILGESRKIEFHEGIPTTRDMVKYKSKYYQGTEITFIPSRQVMTNLDKVRLEDVLELIRDMTMLTPIGSIVHFRGTYTDGRVYEEDIVNKNGIITDLIHKTASPLINPVSMHADNGDMMADIAFVYDSSDFSPEQITSFSNGNKTTGGGTHVDSFLDSISKYFRNYMNKIYLANSKTKLQVTNTDIRTGLKAIIATALLRPAYGGQNKEILTSDEITPFIAELVKATLDEWIKQNPNDLKKLCEFFKDVAHARMKSEESVVKLKDKYTSSSITGMPAKFTKPSGKKELELIICEGD